MSNWIEADQFILTTGATVQSVKFWDLERIGFFQNTIPWAIYSNSGSNKPGNLIASGFSSNLTHILTGRNRRVWLYRIRQHVRYDPSFFAGRHLLVGAAQRAVELSHPASLLGDGEPSQHDSEPMRHRAV